jgi:DNA-binding transcriptional MerR regulator
VENYFNYFTEIEECFRRCRGTPTFLSTLDWALIESWKEAGVPLEAVLIGVERAFRKFAKRPQRFRKVNGLAYCSQTVLQAAQELSATLVEGGTPGNQRAVESPFSVEEIQTYLHHNADTLEKAGEVSRQHGQPVLAGDLHEAAALLKAIPVRELVETTRDLEELERRLSALEDKLTASLTRAASVELLAQFRLEVGRELTPYRTKMTAAQIESLERQWLKKRLFEHHQVSRLSLFYL